MISGCSIANNLTYRVLVTILELSPLAVSKRTPLEESVPELVALGLVSLSYIWN